MLPSFHTQHYEQFRQILREVQDTTSQDTVDRAVLKSSVAKLQHYFQNQILTLELNGLDATDAQRIRSIQVEIDKQLKLLSMDGMFLQAAKQATTVQQRLQQVSDRLRLLHRYCQALLEAE